VPFIWITSYTSYTFKNILGNMHEKNSGSVIYTQQTMHQSLKYYAEVNFLKKMKKKNEKKMKKIL
jgi:hypothetical protein